MFEQFLEILKANYDYVIVDTPPINAVIDGAIVAKSCDGTVMVLEQGVTERAEAIRMKRQLTYAGVKIIGAVLNKVGADPNGYGYGYGLGLATTGLIGLGLFKMIRKRRAKNNGQ